MVRHTPKGVWVADDYSRDDKRFWKLCLIHARKRYAYPTKAEAWESLRIRTQHRVQHAKNALEAALAAQKFMEEHNVW